MARGMAVVRSIMLAPDPVGTEKDETDGYAVVDEQGENVVRGGNEGAGSDGGVGFEAVEKEGGEGAEDGGKCHGDEEGGADGEGEIEGGNFAVGSDHVAGPDTDEGAAHDAHEGAGGELADEVFAETAFVDGADGEAANDEGGGLNAGVTAHGHDDGDEEAEGDDVVIDELFEDEAADEAGEEGDHEPG